MRRKNREIKDISIIETILKNANVCRIALSQDHNPYIVPMIYVYSNNCVYLHSASEGKKINIIKQNNRVCFEVDEINEIITDKKACSFSIKYKSVIGFGKAHILSEVEQKRNALNLLMEKYSDKKEWDYFKASLDNISIIKIEFDEITGKWSK